MPSERKVRTHAEIIKESGTQPLPASGKVSLRGDAAGLPQLVGFYQVGSVLGLIGQLEEVRAGGGEIMQHQILATLQAADVAALSVARPCKGWDDLLLDLQLWHVVRLVFEGIPLPWVAGEDRSAGNPEAASFTSTPSPGCMELVQPDGRVMYLAPPPGAVLQLRTEPGMTKFIAVWPDGRERMCMALVAGPQ